jgi:hypothetical protein
MKVLVLKKPLHTLAAAPVTTVTCEITYCVEGGVLQQLTCVVLRVWEFRHSVERDRLETLGWHGDRR